MEGPLHIALVAEKRSTYLALGYSEADCAALPHEGEIQAIFDALTGLGHYVTLVLGIRQLVKQLATGHHRNWDLVFNISQGFHGPAREAQVPALLEAYNITHTFSDATTMALCQNKANAKIVLDHHGIPTAPFIVISANERDPLTAPGYEGLLSNCYPLFAKPVTEGSSKGIEYFNKINEPSELETAIQMLRAALPGQDILVESFLGGREFTVSILGTGTAAQVIGIREHLWAEPSGRTETTPSSSSSSLPPSEDAMTNGNGIHFPSPRPDYANRMNKSRNGGNEKMLFNDEHDMDDPLIKAACQVSLEAWTVFGCRDAGRVDLRFDSDGPNAIPNVLEVNPISNLMPRHSPLPVCAEVSGIDFQTLLASIVASALRRKSETVDLPEEQDEALDNDMEIPLVIIESD